VSVNASGKNKPTNLKSRFVAPEQGRSRELRRLLAGLWLFVRRERPLPGLGGEISLWICQLHGLALLRKSANAAEMGSDSELGEALKIFGPELSPEEIKGKLAGSDAIQSDARFQSMIEAANSGDMTGFNESFQVIAKSMIELWLPNFKPPFDFSFRTMLQMTRALRGTLVCTALHPVHPLILIARAWKGDKEAVLDLVRIDKLFLQDRCAQEVIRNAALRNDQQFMDQLAKAQKYQPRLHRRDLLHLYFAVLFILEELGHPLPRIDELQRLLDPPATLFKGLYAFEKDLQRRRKRFTKMFAEAHAEFPALLSFYPWASPEAS
jgi:hypothetical protein